MNEVIEYFDQISEAPDAIPRLRRFILDLAVRGKLVEQDPNDEPASELLKRIQAGRALVENGDGKLTKSLKSDPASEIPFTIPAGWEVVRLGCSLTNSAPAALHLAARQFIRQRVWPSCARRTFTTMDFAWPTSRASRARHTKECRGRMFKLTTFC